MNSMLAGSILKRFEEGPLGLPITIEWSQPDGLDVLIRILFDPGAASGLRVDKAFSFSRQGTPHIDMGAIMYDLDET